ncbi:Forkhead box protein E4, partial [Bulinus truncatus]
NSDCLHAGTFGSSHAQAVISTLQLITNDCPCSHRLRSSQEYKIVDKVTSSLIMQSHHFDAGTYPGAIYGATPGFEAGNIKLHHSSYPGDSENGCYSNHGTTAIQTHGYNCRDPPAYPDTFFHTGFMSTFSNANYYKMSNRQMEANDSANAGFVSRSQDNFLMKPQDSLNASPNGYDSHSHHQLIHQQQQQQQQHHHQQQVVQPVYDDASQPLEVNKRLQEGSVFHSMVKMEPLSSHLEYTKSLSSSTSSTSTIAPCHHSIDIKSSNLAAGGTSDQAALKFEDPHNDELVPGLEAPQDKCPLKEETLKSSEEITGEAKPTMSYIALIAKAILESEQRRLNLGSIYNWIEKHYPFYKNKGQGWRNSVRHNLSLNDCFIKVELNIVSSEVELNIVSTEVELKIVSTEAGRCEDGKGNYWAIHPANIQDFMRGDFRQRRRSRRRGRKKECDLSMYHVPNSYLPSAAAPLGSSMAFNPAALSSIYSPYTEAERRAYRLDEALLRQSMTNPLAKWYQQGVCSPNYGGSTSPPACGSGMYSNPTGTHWTQSYNETPTQPMHKFATAQTQRQETLFLLVQYGEEVGVNKRKLTDSLLTVRLTVHSQTHCSQSDSLLKVRLTAQSQTHCSQSDSLLKVRLTAHSQTHCSQPDSLLTVRLTAHSQTHCSKSDSLLTARLTAQSQTHCSQPDSLLTVEFTNLEI